MPNGSTLVIRNWEGTVVFGWLFQQRRMDHQQGYCCSIFRNESPRLSSSIILECEQIAFSVWGPNRVFTYINPSKLKSSNPGFCFKMAGYRIVGRSSERHFLLLAKEPR